MACFWLSSWAHKVLWSTVVGGEVVGRSVGGGGLVGGGWVATGAESGGGATVVSGVVVASELDGGSTDVGRVVAGAESAGARPGGLGRSAVAAGVEAGATVAVELGPTTSSNKVAGSAGTSSSQAAVVGTVDVDVSEVVVAFVNVRAVVVAGAATDAGVGVGPSPGLPELGPCHSVARTNRTTSSTEMTASATVLPGCGRSLRSMRHYYPTRRVPQMARSAHSRTPSACLAAALVDPATAGIRGGLSAPQRRSMSSRSIRSPGGSQAA
jgi:hypothetical protein